MRTIVALSVALSLPAVLSAPLAAAEKDSPVTVVLKNGKKTHLESLGIGTVQSGLLGTSFRALDKLPFKTEDLVLEVPIKNLAKIEVLAVEEKGKKLRLKLTDRKGESLEGTVEREKPLVWRGKYRFADADVTLEAGKIKEIILKTN
ncbi:MAG: hypothetical protein ACOC70_01750 [bacterium]